MLNPWGDQTGVDSNEQQSDWANFSATLQSETAGISNHQNTFGDDFVKKPFETLPDSSEYLSILERKLSRLQSKKQPNSSSSAKQSRDLVNGLSAVRADHMRSFLARSSPRPESAQAEIPTNAITTAAAIPGDSIFTESDPLYTSWLSQRLFPDRQALSEEELAALIRHDVLAGLTEAETACSPPGHEDAASQSTPVEESPARATIPENEVGNEGGTHRG